MSLKRYVVTRDLPGVDSFSQSQLKDAATTSNKALDELKGEVVWVNSFLVADKTYCIYQAKVRAHCCLKVQGGAQSPSDLLVEHSQEGHYLVTKHAAM